MAGLARLLLGCGATERRSTLKNPAAWLYDAIGGGSTASGISVSEIRALNLSAVWCAVTILSDSVKTLPIHTYRNLAGGGKEAVPTHPVHALLHGKPNPEMSPSRFKSYMQYCACMWNAGYAAIEMGDKGYPEALWPIHPSRVVIRRDNNDKLFFEVRTPDGTGTQIYSDKEILRIHGTTADGMTGSNLVRLARESFGLTLATEEHGATFFGNGARPGGALRHPAKLGDEAAAALKKQWNENYQGSGKAHQTAVLEEGMEYQTIGMPNEVSQFLETRQFQIAEIARWFNIPPHMLKDLQRATFSNIEHQSIEFARHSVTPWLISWEDELNDKLFSGDERGKIYVKFNTNALMRGDAKARAAFYKEMVSWGLMSRNEVRALEDLNPVDGGDDFMVPMNMTTPELLAETPADSAMPSEPEPDDDEDEEEEEDDGNEKDSFNSLPAIILPICRDTYGRIVNREVDRIRRAARKHGEDVRALNKWLVGFYGGTHREFVEASLASVLDSAHAAGGDLICPSDVAERYCANSRGQLLGILRDVGVVGIEPRLSEWSRARAGDWANAETARMFGED